MCPLRTKACVRVLLESKENLNKPRKLLPMGRPIRPVAPRVLVSWLGGMDVEMWCVVLKWLEPFYSILNSLRGLPNVQVSADRSR
jgi:hypothetical protein